MTRCVIESECCHYTVDHETIEYLMQMCKKKGRKAEMEERCRNEDE